MKNSLQTKQTLPKFHLQNYQSYIISSQEYLKYIEKMHDSFKKTNSMRIFSEKRNQNEMQLTLNTFNHKSLMAAPTSLGIPARSGEKLRLVFA